MASHIIQSIAYAAGKSGGHIIPCLALMLQQPSDRFSLFFTTNAPLDARIIQTNTKPTKHVQLPLSYSYDSWYKKPLLLWHLLISLCISIYQLWYYKPKKLITTGGLIAIPVCLAAYGMRIPIELYELNAVPGKSARFIAYWASKIYVCFSDAQPYFASDRTSVIPYPLRYTKEHMSKAEACGIIGLNPSMPTLLIMGGSQGSLQLNALAKDIVQTCGPDIQIIHQTGDTDTFDWQTWYDSQHIASCVFTYNNNIIPYIAAADLVICRAGAGSLFELVYFEKPCIIVPLEGAADDHQVANAYAMQRQYPQLCTVIRHSIQEKSSQVISNLVKQKLFPIAERYS